MIDEIEMGIIGEFIFICLVLMVWGVGGGGILLTFRWSWGYMMGWDLYGAMTLCSIMDIDVRTILSDSAKSVPS